MMDNLFQQSFCLFILLLLLTGAYSTTEDQTCGKGGENCGEDTATPKLFEKHEEESLESLEELPVNNHPPLNDKRYVIKDGEKPIVLWWYDSVYPYRNGEHTEIQCKVGRCTMSSDRKHLKSPLTRGFVFYGSSFMMDDLPLPRLPHHEWGLLHEESPKNKWIFSHELGISVFNHTATFRRESDYPLSTQFIPLIDDWMSDEFFVSTQEKNRLQREEGLGVAVYVQRDCNPPSDRDTYVKELMKYMNIDSFGPCVNNKKIPEEINGFHKLSSKPYYHFLARYKFQIAFENCLCQDYMTEKLFRPLVLGSVPVYLGSDKASDFMPTKKAVVMVNDFQSPRDLADYLIKLNENDGLYNEYLIHRDTKKLDNPTLLKILERQPWSIPNKHHKANFGQFMFQGFSCHVCDQIHERNNQLKAHLKDSSQPILPAKTAVSSHMGCPMPKRVFPVADDSESSYGKKTLHNYGLEAGKALVEMLCANETISKNWRKYLKVKTKKPL